jgi:hypothetical protein
MRRTIHFALLHSICLSAFLPFRIPASFSSAESRTGQSSGGKPGSHYKRGLEFARGVTFRPHAKSQGSTTSSEPALVREPTLPGNV